MTKFFEVHKIAAAWSQASARMLPGDPQITAYANALAAEYTNGRVIHATFQLELPDPEFEMAAHQENWKYSQLLEHFWSVPGVAAHLPALGKLTPDVARHFEHTDVFELASFLSSRLFHGGAYSRSTGSPSECLTAGVSCAEAMTEGEAGTVLIANTAWCDFFFDVAWDYTAVVVLPKQRRVKVLLATDTD